MAIKAKLNSQIGGRGVIPNGQAYYLSKVAVGTPAIIYAVNGDEGYRTSNVKEIVVLGEEITIATQNTHYYFTEVSNPEDVAAAPKQPKSVAVTTDNIAVGDKIRVLDRDEIGGGFYLTNDKVYVVVHVYDGESFAILDDEGDTFGIADHEFSAVEKVVSE